MARFRSATEPHYRDGNDAGAGRQMQLRLSAPAIVASQNLCATLSWRPASWPHGHSSDPGAESSVPCADISITGFVMCQPP
jgi:hypothetical protein